MNMHDNFGNVLALGQLQNAGQDSPGTSETFQANLNKTEDHPMEVSLHQAILISSPRIGSPTEDPDLMESGVQGLEIE